MLVDVSVVDQRYQAVLAVHSGVAVVEVAPRLGVSRQSAAPLAGRLSRRRPGGPGHEIAGPDSRP